MGESFEVEFVLRSGRAQALLSLSAADIRLKNGKALS